MSVIHHIAVVGSLLTIVGFLVFVAFGDPIINYLLEREHRKNKDKR